MRGCTFFEYTDVLLEPKMRRDGFNFHFKFCKNCGMLQTQIGALLIPERERGTAPRYLICDEAARAIFVSYLEEGRQWKMRSGTSRMRRKKTDCGIALFLQCAENSACHGRKPARSKRLSLRRLPESIMKEKQQNEI